MTLSLLNKFKVLLITVSLVAFVPGIAVAQSPIDCTDPQWQKTSFCDDQVGSEGGSVFGDGGILNNILEVIIIVITITSVFVIMISGLRFVFSGGDPQSTSAARNGIIYALVGLAIAFLAQSIVVFVLNKL